MARVRPLLLLVLGALLTVAFAGCVTTTNQPGNDDDDAQGATFRSDGQFGLEWERVDIPDRIEPGTERTWHLRAVNEGAAGENEFTYRDGCGHPWRIVLTGPDGSEQDWEGDVMRCQAFQEKTLVGGETKDFTWPWDGRVWDGSEWVDAPSGRHTLTVTFVATHAGVHPTEANAVTTFTVA